MMPLPSIRSTRRFTAERDNHLVTIHPRRWPVHARPASSEMRSSVSSRRSICPHPSTHRLRCTSIIVKIRNDHLLIVKSGSATLVMTDSYAPAFAQGHRSPRTWRWRAQRIPRRLAVAYAINP